MTLKLGLKPMDLKSKTLKRSSRIGTNSAAKKRQEEGMGRGFWSLNNAAGWWCWPEINRQSDISLAKIFFFFFQNQQRIAMWRLQLGRAMCVDSPMTRERGHFYREQKEVGKTITVHGCSLAEFLSRKGLSVGLCYNCRVWEYPLLVSLL